MNSYQTGTLLEYKFCYEIGCDLLEKGKYALAIEQFNLMNPDERSKHAHDVAHVLFMHQQYEASFPFFDYANDLGASIHYPYEVACKLLEYKKYDQAILFFNLAFCRNRLDNDFFNKRGQAYYHAEFYKEAMDDFLMSVQLKQDTDETCYYLAKLYERDDNQNKVLECYEIIDSKAYGRNPYCLLQRSEYYLRIKHYYSAISDCSMIIKHLSNADARTILPAAYIARGDAYKNTGKHGDALTDFYHALELNPDDEKKEYCKTTIFEILATGDKRIPNLNDMDDNILIEVIKKLPDDQAWLIFSRSLHQEGGALYYFMTFNDRERSPTTNTNRDIRVAVSNELAILAKRLGIEYEPPEHIKRISQITLTSQMTETVSNFWNETTGYLRDNYNTFWSEQKTQPQSQSLLANTNTNKFHKRSYGTLASKYDL